MHSMVRVFLPTSGSKLTRQLLRHKFKFTLDGKRRHKPISVRYVIVEYD